jgi:hypothetical protein
MQNSLSVTPPVYNSTPIPGSLASCYIGGPVGAATADQWHHVLISVDLREISTHGAASSDLIDSLMADRVSSSCKLYVAIDDKNYIKGDLPDWVDGGGDNDVISSDAAYTTRRAPQSITNADGTTGEGPIPTYDCAMSIPKGDLGLPATAEYVKNVFKCEMAEFLMFTGVTLDTGVEKNRRLFITAKDNNGRQFPVNPTPIYIPISKTAVGDPPTWEPGADTPAFVPPLSSLDLSAVGSGNKILGTPEVDFTKCSFNWMMGRNLGKFKGKVKRVGKVKDYLPNPMLGG